MRCDYNFTSLRAGTPSGDSIVRNNAKRPSSLTRLGTGSFFRTSHPLGLGPKGLRLATLGLALLLTLSACGVGQFLIKRSIVNLESDIAKELKSYAQFTEQQEIKIDQAAKLSARWVREQRLPILVTSLENLAQDIQSSGQVSEQHWRSFTSYMEDPFEMSGASDLIDSMAGIVFEMDQSQIDQTLKKMQKDHVKEKREAAKRNQADELDDIVKGLKSVFSELGIKRSREQLTRARLTLAERNSYLTFNKENAERQHQRFSALFSDRGKSKLDFDKRFRQAWFDSDQSPQEALPSKWEHNFALAYKAINELLSDLAPEQRTTSAEKIREYAALFQELAKIEGS